MQRRFALNQKLNPGGAMAAEDFKETVFELVEFLTEHHLTNSGRKLVTSYFNDINLPSAFDRALYAVNKYFPDSMPEPEERSEELNDLLERLRRNARDWDNE